MKNNPPSASRPLHHRVMVAVVLGTALTALGPAASAVTEATGFSTRTITDISRYCTTCWRNARVPPDFWGDCTQAVFARLLERVAPTAWSQVLHGDGEERREFLRAIDTVKKRTQRGRKWSNNLVDAVADRRDADDRQRADERAAVRQAAARVLTARQQRILEMSFDGWSVQDIARETGTPAERVSDEKYKAIRKLRQHFDTQADYAQKA